MASDSQILSRSIFDRDRRRGAIGEDKEGQNALADSDETQLPSQPLDHAMITYGLSDAMGNPGAREVLSPEGLWLVHQNVIYFVIWLLHYSHFFICYKIVFLI